MNYWYENCPRCNQGRLFIMRLDDSGKLYLHCEECEWAWDDPTLITQVEAGRLGIDYESEFAESSEIQAAGWSIYALHEGD